MKVSTKTAKRSSPSAGNQNTDVKFNMSTRASSKNYRFSNDMGIPPFNQSVKNLEKLQYAHDTKKMCMPTYKVKSK